MKLLFYIIILSCYSVITLANNYQSMPKDPSQDSNVLKLPPLIPITDKPLSPKTH